MRRFALGVGGVAIIAAACSGSDGGATRPAPPSRSYRMGFSDFPPRIGDVTAYTSNLQMWTTRADGAILHIQPPWDSLIAGVRPDTLVLRYQKVIFDLYRAFGFQTFCTVDVTDGANRQAEAPALVKLGRSITDTSIQRSYRRWVVALDTLMHPDYLGLAAETNLIKLAVATPGVYAAVVSMTNAAAADVRAVDPARKLYVSVQVETAWGRLTNDVYVGVEQDFTDFPFIDALGLSSYPHVGGYLDPADLPADYFSRLLAGRTLPVMVVEGGWTSASASAGTVTIASDPAKQARYFDAQRTLLDGVHAIGWFQLDFADFDTTGAGLPAGSTIPLFTSIGLVTGTLAPKPALAVWDSIFALPVRP